MFPTLRDSSHPDRIDAFMIFLQLMGLIVVSMLFLSAVAVVLMWWDKRSAGAGRRRTPEKTLLTVSLLGGWPGGWWAMQRFRHKTQKRSFRMAFYVVVIAHVGICGVLIWLSL